MPVASSPRSRQRTEDVTLSGFAGRKTWPHVPRQRRGTWVDRCAYVVSGVAKDVPLELIFRGILPLLMALIIAVILMVLFPQIALFLPGLMR